MILKTNRFLTNLLHKTQKYKYIILTALKEYLWLAKARTIWYIRWKLFNAKTHALLKNKSNFLSIYQLPKPLTADILIPKARSLIIEIGSGHGEVANLLADPNNPFCQKLNISRPYVFVTAEYTKKFYKKVAKKTKQSKHILPVYGDGYKMLKLIPQNAIDALLILFPDPWHKKRHHKRRPLNARFFIKIIPKLKPKGIIIIATDHKEYYDYILYNLKLIKHRVEIATFDYNPTSLGLPQTHYYKKWSKLGKSFYGIKITKTI